MSSIPVTYVKFLLYGTSRLIKIVISKINIYELHFQLTIAIAEKIVYPRHAL